MDRLRRVRNMQDRMSKPPREASAGCAIVKMSCPVQVTVYERRAKKRKPEKNYVIDTGAIAPLQNE